MTTAAWFQPGCTGHTCLLLTAVRSLSQSKMFFAFILFYLCDCCILFFFFIKCLCISLFFFFVFQPRTRAAPRSDALLQIYKIRNVTYCDRVGWHRKAASHSCTVFCWCFSEFTSGFHIFCEKHCLVFRLFSVTLSEHTHISSGVCSVGISGWGLFVRLNGWRATGADVVGWYFPGELNS